MRLRTPRSQILHDQQTGQATREVRDRAAPQSRKGDGDGGARYLLQLFADASLFEVLCPMCGVADGVKCGCDGRGSGGECG